MKYRIQEPRFQKIKFPRLKMPKIRQPRLPRVNINPLGKPKKKYI
jgi:hypothetical protein